MTADKNSVIKKSNGLLVSISLVICFIVLELFSGWLFNHLPSRLDNGKKIVERYAGLEPTVRDRVEPHPYTLYQSTKNFISDGFVQTNSLGYRSPEFTTEKPDQTYRVLAIGGSTTYMWPYVPNPKDTWVSLLKRKLESVTSKKIQVINGGMSNATSAELLSSYLFRHQYLKPDLIIIHTGGNDVLPLLYPDYNPEYTHVRSHGNGYFPRPVEGFLLKHSNVLKVLYAIWLRNLRSVYKAYPYKMNELDPNTVLQRVKSNQSTGFRRNLDAIIRFAHLNGSKVLLFGFLQAKKENIAKNVPLFQGLEESWVVGLEKHYQIMRNLSKKHGIDFIEPKQELFKDEWFLDNCHLNEEGEAMKAKILFEYFKQHQEKYFQDDTNVTKSHSPTDS